MDEFCPCGSGKPFVACHGDFAALQQAEQEPAWAPLHIHTHVAEEGRVYKVVGTDAERVQEEAWKAFLWVNRRRD